MPTLMLMFIISHFAIPFYAHHIAGRRMEPRAAGSSGAPPGYSLLCGCAGILPDLFNIHLTLTARHNSFTHTLFFPVIILLAAAALGLLGKKTPKYLSLWLSGAALSHLLLDALAGGVKPFPGSEVIVGDYFIAPQWWGAIDIFFLILLNITFRFHFKKKRGSKAEFYN